MEKQPFMAKINVKMCDKGKENEKKELHQQKIYKYTQLIHHEETKRRKKPTVESALCDAGNSNNAKLFQKDKEVKRRLTKVTV